MKKIQLNQIRNSKYFWYKTDGILTINRYIYYKWEAVFMEILGMMTFPTSVLFFYMEFEWAIVIQMIETNAFVGVATTCFIFGALIGSFTFFVAPIFSFLWKPKIVEFNNTTILFYRFFSKDILAYQEVKEIYIKKVEDQKFGRVNFVDICYELRIQTVSKDYKLIRVLSSMKSKDLEEMKVMLTELVAEKQN